MQHNAVAGGGSFIGLPALMFTGVGAIAANATNTVALWVGVTASTGAYRRHLDISRRVMIPLAISSVIGGVAGAYIMLHTPAPTFLRVLPWLMLGATLLFLFGNRLSRSSGGCAGARRVDLSAGHRDAVRAGRRGLRRLFRRRSWDHQSGNAGRARHDRHSRYECVESSAWRHHQRHRSRDVHPCRRSRLERMRDHDCGRGLWWILRSTLRPEAGGKPDPLVRDRGRNGDECVFLLEGIPLVGLTFVICHVTGC